MSKIYEKRTWKQQFPISLMASGSTMSRQQLMLGLNFVSVFECFIYNFSNTISFRYFSNIWSHVLVHTKIVSNRIFGRNRKISICQTISYKFILMREERHITWSNRAIRFRIFIARTIQRVIKSPRILSVSSHSYANTIKPGGTGFGSIESS